MSKEEIALNIQLAANFLASLLKKNWQNIKVRFIGERIDRVTCVCGVSGISAAAACVRVGIYVYIYVIRVHACRQPSPKLNRTRPPTPTGHVHQEHHGPPLPDLLLSAPTPPINLPPGLAFPPVPFLA